MTLLMLYIMVGVSKHPLIVAGVCYLWLISESHSFQHNVIDSIVITVTIHYKAVGGDPVSLAVARPVFDNLSVKDCHTVYWACAISNFTLCIYSWSGWHFCKCIFGYSLHGHLAHNFYHHKLMAGPD